MRGKKNCYEKEKNTTSIHSAETNIIKLVLIRN